MCGYRVAPNTPHHPSLGGMALKGKIFVKNRKKRGQFLGSESQRLVLFVILDELIITGCKVTN